MRGGLIGIAVAHGSEPEPAADPLRWDPMAQPFDLQKLARAAGLEGPGWTWDPALPLDFSSAIHDRLGLWPYQLGIVWAYGPSGPFRLGGPFALTPQGAVLLAWASEPREPSHAR